MNNKTITFIGAGNMGGAIISGLISKNLVKKEQITVYDAYKAALEKAQSNYGVNISEDIAKAVKDADLVILAVKPNIIDSVLDSIKNDLKKDGILISIAAGVTIERLVEKTFAHIKVARIMPNTPAMVGEAMSSVSVNGHLSKEETDLIVSIFGVLGRAELVDESLIDAVTGLSGSGPAYVYMFIEALADAGVLNGLPRDKAYQFAAQTVLGSAKMVLETGKHPGELKDMVTSPAGTTIEAVKSLEKNSFRHAVIEAVTVASQKSKAMRK